MLTKRIQSRLENIARLSLQVATITTSVDKEMTIWPDTIDEIIEQAESIRLQAEKLKKDIIREKIKMSDGAEGATQLAEATADMAMSGNLKLMIEHNPHLIFEIISVDELEKALEERKKE